jgi:hypothetical protein
VEVAERIIPYKRPDVFTIHPLGDIHVGTEHCAYEKIQRQIEKIAANDFAYWIGLGDYGEFISPHDKRWDCQVISPWVEQDNIAECLTNRIVKLFEPIKDKCLGLIEGNNEDAIRRLLDVNVQKNLCERLGVSNLGYSCFYRLVFRRRPKVNRGEGHSYTLYITHGNGGAITKGAKVMRLQRMMDNFQADVYMMGHMHDIITDTKSYLRLTEVNKISHLTKVGAVTGSWFRTYSQGVKASYGEIKGYPPSALGCPVFTICPDKNLLKVEG